MILMPVGYDYPSETILVLLKIGKIGNDQIYAGHLVVRELQTAVYNEHIIAALIHIKVFTYLVKPAQRYEPHRGGARFSLLRLFSG